MISPAYMLPKSRSECDSGLETYSTRLNSKLNATSSGESHSGRVPNGAQKSSCIQPPMPLTLRLKKIISNHTESASAKVVLTSAVGTGLPVVLVEDVLGHPGHDIHRQEIHRVHQQHPDEHRDCERGDELARRREKMPFACSSTKPEQQLDERLALARHTQRGAAHDPPSNPNATTPSRMEVTTVSRCSVQNGPSPSDTVRCVRWCSI